MLSPTQPASNQHQYIIIITDVLCGKDRSCALHKGSQHFKSVIDSYRATYQKAHTKYDKMQITKEIYEVLSQNSRFLKFNDQEKVWEEVS